MARLKYWERLGKRGRVPKVNKLIWYVILTVEKTFVQQYIMQYLHNMPFTLFARFKGILMNKDMFACRYFHHPLVSRKTFYAKRSKWFTTLVKDGLVGQEPFPPLSGQSQNTHTDCQS